MGTKDVKTIAVDTNVLVRYLTNDIPSQADEVEKLFIKADSKKLILLLSPVVVGEATFVLQTHYKQSLVDISAQMQGLLSQSWWTLEHGQVLLNLWSWYEQGNHFVDSYLIALNKFENIELFSFDKKLNKMVEKKG